MSLALAESLVQLAITPWILGLLGLALYRERQRQGQFAQLAAAYAMDHEASGSLRAADAHLS